MKGKQVQAICMLIVATVLQSALVLGATSGDEIVGIWLTKDKDRISVYRQGGMYFAKPLVDATDQNKTDIHNPDPALRNRALTQVLILQNFEYAKDGQWTKGRVYDPYNGKTYQSRINMPNPRTLKIRGYIGIPLFGRTEVWTRVRTESSK